MDDGRPDQAQPHVPRQHGRAGDGVLLVPDDALDQPGVAAPVLFGPRDADPARGVHRFLPDAAALEGLAIGRDAVVGSVVQTQLRPQIRGEPVAEFLAEALVLGGELEIHDGCESRLVGEPRRCQDSANSRCREHMICPLFVASDLSALRALASQSNGWEGQHALSASGPGAGHDHS